MNRQSRSKKTHRPTSMSTEVTPQSLPQSTGLDASQPTQILFSINLNGSPFKSLRKLVGPANLHDKPIVLYQKRFNGSSTVIGLINGSQIGLGISNFLGSRDIMYLSTTDNPQPTETNPLMYCLYYDPLYTMTSGMWELFYGNFNDTGNQHSVYFPDGDNLMDYFKCLHDTDFTDAYYIHHKFTGGSTSTSDHVILYGMN